jgi:spore maturation protein CgeB
MKILFLGLTITSSWGNGHATTFRSLCRALADRGHHVAFLEKDVEWYRNHRDLAAPEYCRVKLYREWKEARLWLGSEIKNCDAVILGSYFSDGVLAATFLIDRARCPIFFYDIDTPITLEAFRSKGNSGYMAAELLPSFDGYLSFTGGPTLEALVAEFRVQRAYPLYCSVDSRAHSRREAKQDYVCDLSYLGTYSEDRQPKLEDLLLCPANKLPERSFLIGGALYPASITWPGNVRHLDHVAPAEHSFFYSSSRFTLNLTRDAMVRAGYSPSVRLFEAAACAAPILSDSWPGIEEFFFPGPEILLPRNGEELQEILQSLSDTERLRIGQAAQARILEKHTHERRAQELERIIESVMSGAAGLELSSRTCA